MRVFKWVMGILCVAVVAGLIFFWGFLPGIAEDGMNPVAEHDPYPVSAEAQALHDDMIIGDWHADSLMWNRDLNKRGTRGHVDVPRLVEGNVAIQTFTMVTKSPAGQNYEENSAETRDNITLVAMAERWPLKSWFDLTERAMHMQNKLHKFAEDSDGWLMVIESQEDLDTLFAEREAGLPMVGGLLGIEGGHALEADIANLDRLYDNGLRLIGLQHFFDNALGSSLHGEAEQGLSDFGRDVVTRAVERGMIVDLAHSSPQVARDVLAMTDIPLIVSHTGIFSHCERKRNFTDDLMQEIAATGGVIGIGYWAEVTCDDTPAGIAATIQAAIDVVGEDHVSLGSDFDGSIAATFDTSELAALTQAMLDVGLTPAQIRKVAGENMLRVLRARLP